MCSVGRADSLPMHALVAVTLVAAALTGVATAERVKIAGLYPLSDASAGISVQLSKAAQLAVAAVTSNGTLLPVDTLTVVDFDTSGVASDVAYQAYGAVQVCVVTCSCARVCRLPTSTCRAANWEWRFWWRDLFIFSAAVTACGGAGERGGDGW